MTKRFLFAAALLFMMVMPLAAYSDNFYETSTDPEYVALISAIKNGENEETVLDAYDKYISSGISDIERCRVEYHMARYYKDKGNKNKGNEHVEMMKSLYSSLPSDISEFERLVCRAEITSADYYVNRKLSVGMENSNLAKELYSKYPDDVFSILNESWRLIFTPAIAGGSTKKAIGYLDNLMKNKEKLSVIDTYSVYCAYAMAYNSRGNYKKADEYFRKAFEYFDAEADVVETYKENLKKL